MNRIPHPARRSLVALLLAVALVTSAIEATSQWAPADAPALTPPQTGAADGLVDAALEGGMDTPTGAPNPKLPAQAQALAAFTGTFDCTERLLAGDDQLYDLSTVRSGAWTVNGLALELRSWGPQRSELAVMLFDQQQDRWRLDRFTAPNYSLEQWVSEGPGPGRGKDSWRFRKAATDGRGIHRLALEPEADGFRMRQEDLRRPRYTTVHEVRCRRRDG